MVLAVCLCLFATAFSEKIKTYAGSDGISLEYETKIFDTEAPVEVNILMESEDWEDMLSNASAEEYKECDVEIAGTTFYRVGIRPKGNTSLSSIASDPTTDRYSFKLEFDRYVDGQTCFGLDKLVLNNNYADATNMKEALVYDLFKYVGADASLCNYAKISVNGEYWGVYIALEAVEDSFLLRNYGAQSGELYKPESMEIGGNGGGQQGGNEPKGNENFKENLKNAFPNNGDVTSESESADTASGETTAVSKTAEESSAETSSENSAEAKTDFSDKNLPEPNGNFGGNGGGFSKSSGGADLNYIDDELDSYSTIWEGEVTDSKKADHKRVVTALKNISEGTELETYMDIDNLVKYMAVHVFSVNEDSLSGTMAHNYYLYESGGKLNLIPWDYNLALGGMGGGNDATSVVNEAIDNAFSATNFFDKLTENEEYNALYYDNLEKVVEYINGGEFEKFYNRVRSQIDELAKTDPNAFYDYDEYTEAAETLYELVKLRGESIEKQLSGTIPSTAELQKNSDSLVDASSLNLSVLGSMGGGNRGGFDIQKVNAAKTENESSASTESSSSENGKAVASSQNQSGPPEMPSGQNGSPPAMPNGEMPSGDFPGGAVPPGMNGEATNDQTAEAETTAQNEQTESESETSASGETSETTSPASESSSSETTSAEESADERKGGFPGGDGQMQPPGTAQSASGSLNGKNFAVYGICLGVMLLFLAFAALYKRRPGKG